MRLKQYSSDISARGWQAIEKILVVQRSSKWELKQIVNAIFYITKNGCVWRDLLMVYSLTITISTLARPI
jgi:transposase